MSWIPWTISIILNFGIAFLTFLFQDTILIWLSFLYGQRHCTILLSMVIGLNWTLACFYCYSGTFFFYTLHFVILRTSDISRGFGPFRCSSFSSEHVQFMIFVWFCFWWISFRSSFSSAVHLSCSLCGPGFLWMISKCYCPYSLVLWICLNSGLPAWQMIHHDWITESQSYLFCLDLDLYVSIPSSYLVVIVDRPCMAWFFQHLF